MNIVSQVKRHVDLDDWCAPELLTAEDGVACATCDHAAVVNHVFLNAYLDRLPSHTFVCHLNSTALPTDTAGWQPTAFPARVGTAYRRRTKRSGCSALTPSLNGRPRPTSYEWLRLRSQPL